MSLTWNDYDASYQWDIAKVIEKLDTLPTQLYVSVDAPNKEVFDEICRPKWNSAAWDKFEETIDLLPSLDTRIVCRHTLIKAGT